MTNLNFHLFVADIESIFLSSLLHTFTIMDEPDLQLVSRVPGRMVNILKMEQAPAMMRIVR